MAGEPSYSARWSVMIGANPSFSGSSVRHPYKSDTVRKTQKLLKSPQMRGTRATAQAQTQYGVNDVQGDLTFDASPALLGFHLVQAMGGGTAASPVMADLLPEWALLSDRGTGGHALGACYKYLGLKTNRLRLSARAAGLVEGTVSVFGKTETGGQTFSGAALANTLAEEPFTASMMALEIDPGGVAQPARVLDWTFTIDNGLQQRYCNSDTVNEILEGERSVTFEANVALDTNVLTDLYGVAKAGLAATLTLTNSTVSSLLTFAALQFNPETITAQGNEFILPLRCEVRGTSGAEMTATNDLTP